MASNLDPNTMLKTCPYNRNHRVSHSKYQNHLSKCKKQFGQEVKLKICPYNVEHRMPESELDEHKLNCPDGKQVWRQLFNPKIPVKKSDINDNKVGGEDIWSDEYDSRFSSGFTNVLELDEMTAEQLFEITSKRDGFTDSMYLSKLKPEERVKYNKMIVEFKNIERENKDLAKADTEVQVIRAMSSGTGSAEKALRLPETKPFSSMPKNVGIGRGSLIGRPVDFNRRKVPYKK